MDVEKKLTETFGLDKLDPNTKEVNLVYLNNALITNLGVSVAEQLSDDDFGHFNNLMNTDPEKAYEFVSNKIPDFLALVDGEILKLKQLKDELFLQSQ